MTADKNFLNFFDIIIRVTYEFCENYGSDNFKMEFCKQVCKQTCAVSYVFLAWKYTRPKKSLMLKYCYKFIQCLYAIINRQILRQRGKLFHRRRSLYRYPDQLHEHHLFLKLPQPHTHLHMHCSLYMHLYRF